MFLSISDFSQVVQNTPLVSIDLCILKGRELLLGERVNPPAKNFFFVPGGRILKSELIKNAFNRILKNELGLSLKNNHNDCIKNLGCYEHFYNDNFLGNSDFSTHYVVLAYLIPFESLIKNYDERISEQHSEYIWIDIDNLKSSSYKIHSNSMAYLDNPIFRSL
tara:strand:- start:719 stop:1210 length:492 start_codon:yes stop_codon:yes gene_type:complete